MRILPQLGEDVKNKLSDRAKALEKLKKFLSASWRVRMNPFSGLKARNIPA